jgi:hypothetical protein
VLPENLPAIVQRIYRRATEKVWSDNVVTERERRALDKIVRCLRISESTRREIEFSFGLDVFERALAEVTADGTLDEEDGPRLATIAWSLGTNTRDLVVNHFKDRGEAIVRAMFTSISEDGEITDQEWLCLITAARRLGLAEGDVHAVVRAQAQRFSEHVLAEAKADGTLDELERRKLNWLLTHLELPATFRSYLAAQIERLAFFTDVSKGNLPIIQFAEAGIRAGELAHLHVSATYYLLRQLKSGNRYDKHDGELLITDSRSIFTSLSKTLDINHRKIISVSAASQGIEIRSSGKGTGLYAVTDPELVHAVLSVAVSRANQTIVYQGTEGRHIPRDVRQRVWQRYGGRCAECGATQYLEFDHIVPHANGGNNGDKNVQLLCRGCNAKKSDFI